MLSHAMERMLDLKIHTVTFDRVSIARKRTFIVKLHNAKPTLVLF